MLHKTTLTGVISGAFLASAAMAEDWDMPMAYAATNFHSEMGVVFADKVRVYTNGAINITVHPGGSLFKGGEIKRAVQTGQAPIGERFMSAHANEAPLLGWDNLPFLATTYEQNDKLWAAPFSDQLKVEIQKRISRGENIPDIMRNALRLELSHMAEIVTGRM